MSAQSYIVNIDSEYRNTNIYTNPTDFSVKLITPTPTNPPVVYGAPSVGTPISSSSTGAVNTPNSFLTPVQIDPDFYNANFNVINGQIQNIQLILTSTFIISGIINPVYSQSFQLNNSSGATVINYLTLSTGAFPGNVNSTGSYNVFLASLTYNSPSGAYFLDWCNYSNFGIPSNQGAPTYGGSFASSSQTSTFTIDVNNNIYWLFDFTCMVITMYNTINGTTRTDIYPLSINYPIRNSLWNLVDTTYNIYRLGWASFTYSGTLLNSTAVNSRGINTFTCNACGITNSYLNGKSVIKVDTALNVYIGTNINNSNTANNVVNPFNNFSANTGLYQYVLTTAQIAGFFCVFGQNTLDSKTYFTIYQLSQSLTPGYISAPRSTGTSAVTYTDLYTYNSGIRTWCYQPNVLYIVAGTQNTGGMVNVSYIDNNVAGVLYPHVATQTISPATATGTNIHTNAISYNTTNMFSASLNIYGSTGAYNVLPVVYNIALSTGTTTINNVVITGTPPVITTIGPTGALYGAQLIIFQPNYYIYPYILGGFLYLIFALSRTYNAGPIIAYIDTWVYKYTITSATTLTYISANKFFNSGQAGALPVTPTGIPLSNPLIPYFRIVNVNDQFVACAYTQVISAVTNLFVVCSRVGTATSYILNITGGQAVLAYTYIYNQAPVGYNNIVDVYSSTGTGNNYAFNSLRSIYDITDLTYSPILLTDNFSPNIGYETTTYMTQVFPNIYGQAFPYQPDRLSVYTSPTGANMVYIRQSCVALNTYNIEYNAYGTYSDTSIVSGEYQLQGWGIGLLIKIFNNNTISWICPIGSIFTIDQGVNINISDICIDAEEKYLYAIGGWQNMIQTFNGKYTSSTAPNSVVSNQITSLGNPYQNGFIVKLDISQNGVFKWLIPIIPNVTSGNISLQNMSLILASDNVVITVNFTSSNMIVYTPQTSMTGSTFINPDSAILNLTNTSTGSAAIISITPAGTLSFHCNYFSNIAGQTVSLYGIDIEENASTYNFTNTIKVSGVTSTTQLLSTDQTDVQQQILYTFSATSPTLFTYTYDLNGNYIESHKSEIPVTANPTLIVGNIVSFPQYNRVINWITFNPSGTNTPIYIFNKDGTLGGVYTPTVLNYNNSVVIQYYYDSSFVDINTKKYSQIKLINYFNTGSNFLFNNDELFNYNIFIQGSLSINANTGTRPISVGTTNDTYPLNNNFTIRYNTTTSTTNTLVLNRLISTKDIKRTNLSCSTIYVNGIATYWAANIGVTPLPSVITFANNGNAGGYQGPTGAGNTGSITVLSVYGQSINTSSTGNYLVFPGSTGTYQYVSVTSISYSTGSNSYTVNIGSTGLKSLVAAYPYETGRYYPNIYLTSVNNFASYILPWNPQSSYQQTYYSLKLNALSIPNRAIYGYISGSVRSINDFEYVVLEIWNENDQGTGNSGILNNIFTNNQNFITPVEAPRTRFQIPVSGININSNNNYIVLTSLTTPTIAFATDYNNIHIKLVDPTDQIIYFDSSYNPNKADDLPFINSSVDQRLMQMNANFTFTFMSAGP